jgi:hypothetical protein
MEVALAINHAVVDSAVEGDDGLNGSRINRGIETVAQASESSGAHPANIYSNRPIKKALGDTTFPLKGST